jgi:hypothetical protein
MQTAYFMRISILTSSSGLSSNNFQNRNTRLYICLLYKSGYVHRQIITCVVCSNNNFRSVLKNSYLQNLLSEFSIEFDLRQLHSKFKNVNQFLYRPITGPERRPITGTECRPITGPEVSRTLRIPDFQTVGI